MALATGQPPHAVLVCTRITYVKRSRILTDLTHHGSFLCRQVSSISNVWEHLLPILVLTNNLLFNPISLHSVLQLALVNVTLLIIVKAGDM